MTDLSTLTLRLSRLIDGTYPANLDPEAHRWRRCAKVAEESGEVVEALLGHAGENPRKGITGGLDELRKELLDVALTALGAVAHIDGNARADTVEQLTAHAAAVVSRLEDVLG